MKKYFLSFFYGYRGFFLPCIKRPFSLGFVSFISYTHSRMCRNSILFFKTQGEDAPSLVIGRKGS
jgi:hypothetical protein